METLPKIVEETPKESEEQARLLAVLRRQGVLFFAVPNGGKRSPREAVAFRRQGVQSGVPDLILPGHDARWRCMGIEMKRAKGGKVSEEQQQWHRLLTACGWKILVCHGADDAIEQLEALGVLRRQGLAAE